MRPLNPGIDRISRYNILKIKIKIIIENYITVWKNN